MSWIPDGTFRCFVTYHWHITCDLSSNSPCKLERSALGFRCQLIRTQIYLKIINAKCHLATVCCAHKCCLREKCARRAWPSYRSCKFLSFSVWILQAEAWEGEMSRIRTLPENTLQSWIELEWGKWMTRRAIATCTYSFHHFLWMTWEWNSEQ